MNGTELLHSTGFAWALAWLAFGKIGMGLVWTWAMNLPPIREHRVYNVQIPASQRWREVKSSWHAVSDAVVLYALVALGLIQFAPNTLAGHLLTFAVFYVWVEVWYYSTHRLMHKYDFLYRWVHRSHHLSRAVTPLSSISMSSAEKWIFYTGGWLGFMAAASWLIPVTLPGILAYFTFHFTISLHGHSNTEASAAGKLLTRVGAGSATSHALHHARFTVNYGFSNMTLDKLLGTYAEETPLLQELAIERRGIQSFRSPRVRSAVG